MPLPTLMPVPQIQARLRIIFPEGITNRNYVTREIAAKTIFVFLYVGAIEGTERWLRPDQVTRMTDMQAGLNSDEARQAWQAASVRPAGDHIEGRWYATNTREPIRDETLREGFVRMGAVKERRDLPTTSPKPRYALSRDFAGLFLPDMEGDELDRAVASWQGANLSGGRLGSRCHSEAICYRSRRKGSRRLSKWRGTLYGARAKFGFVKGGDRRIRDAFLETPGVIWLSESRNQVVARDDKLAQDIGW